jgi:hypothetical protein
MAHEGLRTSMAQQAMVIADIVNRALADRVVGTSPPRRLVIMDVAGPSTDGGKRARQSIVLAPLDEGEKGSLVCGFVDTPRGEAELRPYEVVAALHRQRYGRPFDVTQDVYEALLAELVELFALDELEVRFAEAGASSHAARRGWLATPAARLSLAIALALGVLAAFLALR